MEKLQTVDDYIDSLTGDAKDRIQEFVNFMRKNYSQLEEVLSFQMPTYKLGSGSMRNYIAFSAAKNHFSLHTTDFDYVTELKTKLKNGGKGKGCVNVKFTDKDEFDILLKAISEIYSRNYEAK